MDISSLADALYEDLNASVTSMHLGEDGHLVLRIVCDNWEDNSRQRHFNLLCKTPKEIHISVGPINSITYAPSHPLLLAHNGPQSQLFYSSAPTSPAEIFLKASVAISTALDGWRDPSAILSHSAQAFSSALAIGHGSLARGPTSVIAFLQESLRGLLELSAVSTHTLSREVSALTMDNQWVICESVEVQEVSG
jgi:hypothetical protein